MALLKATVRSIKNRKRQSHWMESGNKFQRLGSIFLYNCSYMTAQYHSPEYESVSHYNVLKWK
jgi:hypothetical protein